MYEHQHTSGPTKRGLQQQRTNGSHSSHHYKQNVASLHLSCNQTVTQQMWSAVSTTQRSRSTSHCSQYYFKCTASQDKNDQTTSRKSLKDQPVAVQSANDWTRPVEAPQPA